MSPIPDCGSAPRNDTAASSSSYQDQNTTTATVTIGDNSSTPPIFRDSSGAIQSWVTDGSIRVCGGGGSNSGNPGDEGSIELELTEPQGSNATQSAPSKLTVQIDQHTTGGCSERHGLGADHRRGTFDHPQVGSATLRRNLDRFRGYCHIRNADML